MRNLNIVQSLALALLLMGCAKTDPVDDNAIAPAGELLNTIAGNGLAASANAAAAEAALQAAQPSTVEGLGWTYNQADRTALFGPPGSPALSIQCQKSKEGEAQLIFVRHLPPPAGATGTLSFTGNGKAASVPVSPVANPDGLGGNWRAAVPPGDNARGVSQTFAGTGTVEVSVTGTPPLVVPASDEPRQVFADCLDS